MFTINKELIDLNNIDKTIIKDLIQQHQTLIGRFNFLDNYYKGQHNILNRKLSLNSSTDSSIIANNKLVNNFAKYITDMATGYFMGNAIQYQSDGIEVLLDAFKHADIEFIDHEIAKDCSIFGMGYELLYMTSDKVPEVRSYNADVRKAFLVYDDTIETKPLFGVYYYPVYKKDLKTLDYYDTTIYTSEKVQHCKLRDLGSETELLEEYTHFFKDVPLIEYQNNEELQGDFEQVLSLIDAYNILQSDRVNDKQQLVDAILLLCGATMDEETLKNLKLYKVLEIPPESRAEWLTKQLNEVDIEVLRNSLKEDIHKFSFTPDLTDKEFASAASGVSLKYKLIGFENMTKTKERYYTKSLRRRLKMYANVLSIKDNNFNIADIKINYVRALPTNVVEVAQMIQQLSGIVSNETLISQLPFIENAQEENKRLEEEKQKNLEQQQAMFDSQFPNQKGDVDEETEE